MILMSKKTGQLTEIEDTQNTTLENVCRMKRQDTNNMIYKAKY